MARIVLIEVSEKEKAEKIIISVLRRRLEEIDDHIRDLRATIRFLEQKYGTSWEEFKKKNSRRGLYLMVLMLIMWNGTPHLR